MNDPGFQIINGVVPDIECERLLRVLSRQNRKQRAGIRNLMALPEIRSVATTDPLRAIVEEAAGVSMIPFKATLFEKTGKSNWLVAFHQDTALPVTHPTDREGWGPNSIKKGVTFAHAPTRALKQILALRVHLDASTESNGPLRMIAGTHLHRITDDPTFDRMVRDGQETKCLVERGGVLVMSPLVIHASSKSLTDAPRRVLHIEYTSTLEIDDDVKLSIA